MRAQKTMYKLLIVDDEPIIRQGIKQLINFQEQSISEVYEAEDGALALAIVREKRPDIVLADINMPNLDGLNLAREIKAVDPEIRVAIITGYDYFEYAVTALKAGVDDYLLKPVSRSDILELLSKLVNDLKEKTEQRRAMDSLASLKQLEHGGNEGHHHYREMILQVMNHSLSDPAFSLGRLAEAINLSSGYLSTVFKQNFGIPFQEYLTTMRLERSKILLLVTSYKIYEIAEKVGFDDPSYFSTCFKKRYGLSPNSYRDTMGGNI
ncbi:response regulator transcription factor [Desulfitobacterium hafniense]|uniref:response regulator transcription factor n=1 Tax=Desulfitobacterium hafniense TaxID=49338 RepID=UPI00039A4371|nr:response regulator [Desulfitobacterium hafniense]